MTETTNSVLPPTMAEAIDVRTAKGRPMLTWVGKQPLDRVPVLPTQCMETFEPLDRFAYPSQHEAPQRRYANAIYYGDNKEVLAHLLANGLRGQVRLIYIDPPFDSGADYVRQPRLRGAGNGRLAAEAYSLGEQVQYTDIWANDNYLQFIYERLPLMRELLAPDGTLWLHCDHRKVHHLRMLLEEIFGPENYLNTIAWRSQVARGAKVNAFYFPYSTHWIEIFAKDRSAPPIWHPPKKVIRLTEEEASRLYMRDAQGFFRTSDPGTYSYERLVTFHEAGRLYAPYGGEVVIDSANRRIYGSNGGNIAIKYYLDTDASGTYWTEQIIDNLWDDIPGLATTPAEEVGYPTQKTEALLERIVQVATNPGDLVLDCFMGSGTTLAVAQKLNRRWLGCDINRGAIQTVSRRLQRIIRTQIGEGLVGSDQAAATEASLRAEKEPITETFAPLDGATFAVYRINGYDLPLDGPLRLPGGESAQAALMRLASEAVGVRRTRNDPFFDGVLGERLVKFADFSRPLLVADLEAIAAELATRSEDGRNIVVICFGRELATSDWLERWNHYRIVDETIENAAYPVEQSNNSNPPQQGLKRRLNRGLNHLEIIELQSDPRYGQLFIHEPAQADVTIECSVSTLGRSTVPRAAARDPNAPLPATESESDTGTIEVRIDEFISPTIIQRLRQQSRVEPEPITDWRTMVDSVAIDPAYDGQTFRALLADAPHKRAELVQGSYRLEAIRLPTTVAVRITDMLGEELLITQDVGVGLNKAYGIKNKEK